MVSAQNNVSNAFPHECILRAKAAACGFRVATEAPVCAAAPHARTLTVISLK
jgi:hypothetical protein